MIVILCDNYLSTARYCNRTYDQCCRCKLTLNLDNTDSSPTKLLIITILLIVCLLMIMDQKLPFVEYLVLLLIPDKMNATIKLETRNINTPERL